MRELVPLVVALAAGMGLGVMFFGGLWWTVVRGVSSRRPALWFVGSKLLRTALALAGFYLAGGARWERWLLCLLGFGLARLATAWVTRSPTRARPHPPSKASYAP